MKKHENGQIIVILAVVLVAVLGITALAVDGSMIYAERRNDQTTADSSALSAAQTASASSTCATGLAAAINQAITYASAQEGVALVNDTTSPNRVEATCNADNTKLTIKIVVTSNTPTTFAKMVSRNQLQTRVESTSQVTFGSGTYAGGAGLWTTGTTCDDNGGIWTSGAAYAIIKGGGAYSGSCIVSAASPGGILSEKPIYYAGKVPASGTNNVRTFYVGTQVEYIGVLPSKKVTSNGIIFGSNSQYFILSNQTTMPSASVQLTENGGVLTANSVFPQSKWPIPTNVIPTPTMDISSTLNALTTANVCAGLPDRGPALTNAASYNPGVYDNMNISPWEFTTVTLAPGTYCIKSNGFVNFYQKNIIADGVFFYFQGAGDFIMDNGIVTASMKKSTVYLPLGNFRVSNGVLNATDITIYLLKGSFTISGGAKSCVLTAPCSDNSCSMPPSTKGLLVYMGPDNTAGTINILNGSGASYAYTLGGTIFAPNALALLDGGTATKTLKFQLIAKRIELGGSAVLILDTNNGGLFQSAGAPSVELLK